MANPLTPAPRREQIIGGLSLYSLLLYSQLLVSTLPTELLKTTTMSSDLTCLHSIRQT